MTTRNPHESAARARKVTRAVAVIDRDAIANGFDPHGRPGIILQALRGASEKQWAEIGDAAGFARNAGKLFPSEETRAAIVAVYAERAEREPHRCPRGHSSCYAAACNERAA